MANLSRSQLAGLAQSVGFAGSDVNIAVAVALAESGGNPGAHNQQGLDDSYGLWQINMKGTMGPERRKKFGISSNTDLFRPAVNAKAAKIIHSEQGWSRGWTTYANGKYKEFLTNDPVLPTGPIENTPGKVGTPEEVEESTTDSSWYGSIANSINAAGKNVFNAGANFAFVGMAALLILLGVFLLVKNSVPLDKVVKTAANVLPAGKALKGVKKL